MILIGTHHLIYAWILAVCVGFFLFMVILNRRMP